MSKFSRSDIQFMERALFLAKKGWKKVSPNPMVGAVLVKQGKIIAEGFHHKYGDVHAEVDALKDVSPDQIRGASLYVTLEPCSHFGKQPPCANFLIEKGIKSLFVAMRDPNPLVASRGLKLLKKHGVEVKVGLLEDQAKVLNKIFVKNITQQMPFITIKLGTTLDGKIARTGGKLKYITHKESLKQVHVERSCVDALLTTSETVLKDNPHLGVRGVKGKDPLRVVIDSSLKTSPSSTVYRDDNVVLVTTNAASAQKQRMFEKKSVHLLVYDSKKIPLKRLLKDLYEKFYVTSVMTEAGSGLVSALLQQRIADELMLFIAPKIFGQGLSWSDHLFIDDLDRAYSLEHVQVDSFGCDIRIQGALHYS